MKLLENPYTATRVVVMRSRLFNRQDYDKMLKLSYSDLAKFLSDFGYAEQINSLGMKYSGANLLDLAINMHHSDLIKKLLRICDEDLKEVLLVYLMRNDLWNVKLVLRNIFSKGEISWDELANQISISRAYLEQMASKNSIVDAITILAKTDLFKTESAELLKLNTSNLIEIETFLTMKYYNYLFEFAKLIPNEAKNFRQFLELEIEMLNLITIAKLKFENVENIQKYLLPSNNQKQINMLSKAVSIQAMFEILIKDKIVTQELGLIEYEKVLHKRLLQKGHSMMHSNPMSIEIILSMVFALSIEAKNLKTIVKGKQLNFEQDKIEEALIYE